MKICSVEIKNFKSIQQEYLDLAGLTIFVGANGSGKSNFLKALDYFYNPKKSVDTNDHFNRDTNVPIEISVTYDELTGDESKHFEKYLTTDKKLCVIKRFQNGSGIGKYYGVVKGRKDFSDLTGDSSRELKEQYQTLKTRPEYQALPDAKTGPAIRDALAAWIENHPEQLEYVESETQFFGFENSSAASLEKFTKFVYIPAVLYESHLEDVKNTPIGDLTDILARHKLKEDEDIKRLKDEISRKYSEKLRPFNTNEMTKLSDGISQTLENYYQGARIKIQLDENNTEINLPSPKADITVEEGGFPTKISLVGQGLQRAFILSLLQYFAENQITAENKDSLNLILGIDEPELYQHPSKQNLFYNVLKGLSKTGSRIASSIQCLYTTHSPLMLSIEDFDQVVRVFKSPPTPETPSATKTKRSDLPSLAKAEGNLPSKGSSFPELKVLSGMVNAINSRINEGFFSNTVVLVEGESDIVALKLAAKHHTNGPIDLDKLDIPILPCTGKANLGKAAIIFSLLDIDTYLIWDSDYGDYEKYDKLKNESPPTPDKVASAKSAADSSASKNRDLLSLSNAPSDDWPSQTSERCASFKYHLEFLLKNEIGEAYLTTLVENHNKIYQAKGPWKNPLVMTSALEEAFSSGKKSATLEAIITKIVELSQHTPAATQEAQPPTQEAA